MFQAPAGIVLRSHDGLVKILYISNKDSVGHLGSHLPSNGLIVALKFNFE